MSSSGCWNYHETKRTTEECWTLTMADLPRGVLEGHTPSGVVRALRLDGVRNILCVRWALEFEGEGPALTLSYRLHGRAEGREIIEWVRLLATKPHFGGTRSWFACPFSSKGEEPCGRRVGKLYLPPGEQRFGCRRCHALTYKSSQESHRYDRLCALMASEDSGKTFEAVKRTLLFNAREARRQASRASRARSKASTRFSGSSDEPTPP